MKKPREFGVEETIKAQRVVNEIYEILEKHDLEEICVWDPNTETLTDIDSMCINGNSLQMNVERWPDQN